MDERDVQPFEVVLDVQRQCAATSKLRSRDGSWRNCASGIHAIRAWMSPRKASSGATGSTAAKACVPKTPNGTRGRWSEGAGKFFAASNSGMKVMRPAMSKRREW